MEEKKLGENDNEMLHASRFYLLLCDGYFSASVHECHHGRKCPPDGRIGTYRVVEVLLQSVADVGAKGFQERQLWIGPLGATMKK